ncbi:hypothetical protein AB4876_09410 [Zhongshania guokunii]|uniref:Uncharacterized protein n=1 Tax=Zhongshania guokunii TaxID=641783 RepID=A0ABV3U810_9GAMM
MKSRSTLSIVITAVMCFLPGVLALVSLPALADAGSDAAIAAISAAGSAGLLGSVGVYIGYAVTGVGAASLLLQGIAKITGITPGTRDDEYVNEAFRVVVKVQRWLDRLAFNPSADKARRK